MTTFETAHPPPVPPVQAHRLETRVFKMGDILRDFQQGRLLVSSHQHRSTWRRRETRKLMDSLYQGYPVGTLLLWAPAEQPETLLVADGRPQGFSSTDLSPPARVPARRAGLSRR